MEAQMKAFFDSTGSLWAAGSLVGKPATMITSTASQSGGQETTIMTAVTQLAHHGMIFVPPGFSYGPAMFDVEAPHGGSAWGAGTFAGPTGDRQPSETELAYTKHQVRARAPTTAAAHGKGKRWRPCGRRPALHLRAASPRGWLTRMLERRESTLRAS